MSHSPSRAVLDDILSPFGEKDTGRRRGQRKGHLRIDHGSWLLTYRVYDFTGRSHRESVALGPAEGSGKFTRKQAERIAWDHYLSKVDQISQQPKTTITVADFWEKHFKPAAMMRLKRTTRDQYFSLYSRWIAPVIGRKRLAVLEPGDVEKCIAGAVEGKLSPASARHIRKVISAIYTRAKKLRYASGDNPASLADAPAPSPVRDKVAHSAVEMAQILSMLGEPIRSAVLTAVITSANASELFGLRWKHLNLTPEWVTLDGEGLHPFTIAIRQHWTRSELGSLKTGNRKRNIPIPQPLVSVLARLKQRPKFTGPEDVVFCTSKGTPQSENNIRRRTFGKIAKYLGLRRLSWHTFRYSHATFTEAIGMHAKDRQALMGHGALDMTDRYTVEDHERMRDGLSKIAGMILAQERVQ